MVRLLFFIAISLYLISNIYSHSIIEILLSLAAFLAVVWSIATVGKIVLTFGILFLAAGFLMLYSSGTSWGEYIFAFGPMMNLLTLFALIPILALPIKLGGYANDVEGVIRKKVKSKDQLYMVSSGTSFFLSSFMNLAALPMTYYSIRPSLNSFPIQDKERFMSRSITHGFAMPVLWTPVTPIVGVVIEMTGVSYTGVITYLVPLSIVGLLLDWFMAKLHIRRNNGSVNKEEAETKQQISATLEVSQEKSHARLLHIILAILLLNIVVMITEYFFELSFIFTISLLVIPFSLAWAVLLKKPKNFFEGLKGHFSTHLLKMKDQFFLFLSAGFFISAINMSGMDQSINKVIESLVNSIGIQFVLIILPFIPLLFAFLGLHPAVTFVLVVEALNPDVLGISHLLLALMMLGSAVPAFLMGPYNATIGVMSNIVEKPPFQISNWNVSFCAVYFVLLLTALQIGHVLI
ncbi:hypothetical protein [Alteribacillus iranensis]|uniref:Di-and tricarboxylate transporter n=1 Tax=Alteribacillus iranensis TaxID=930128 RepID=A0A1I2E421_9BACI|nr:hypothetical protein [Alteribacillus iranensis]SFE87419.1 hypothetical protein SAMN05192532_10579 [Alteribacillus iranensis]